MKPESVIGWVVFVSVVLACLFFPSETIACLLAMRLLMDKPR
jgi:hypothetical protein